MRDEKFIEIFKEGWKLKLNFYIWIEIKIKLNATSNFINRMRNTKFKE